MYRRESSSPNVTCPCCWCGEDLDNTFVVSILNSNEGLSVCLAILTTCSKCNRHVVVGFSAGKGRALFDCYRLPLHWIQVIRPTQIKQFVERMVREKLDIDEKHGVQVFGTSVLACESPKLFLPHPVFDRTKEPYPDKISFFLAIIRDDVHNFYLRELDQLNDPKLWVLGTFTPF